MADRTCATPDCTKPHRARGLCSTHYNQANARPVSATCSVCGAAVIKDRRYADRQAVCSYDCRTVLQHGWPKCPVPADHPSRAPLVCDVPHWHPIRSTRVPINHPSRRTQSGPPPQFFAGYCHECGSGYVIASANVSRSHYCSMRCIRRTAKRARRAREHGAGGTFTWDAFAKLAMALGNVCAYCGYDNDGKPLEPDHVVPLSRGGHNGLANILPSCTPCNRDKTDRTPTEWADLCQLRGRPLDYGKFKHLTAHVYMDKPRRSSPRLMTNGADAA